MCIVSNMGDYGQTIWPKPWVAPSPWDLPKPAPMPGIDVPVRPFVFPPQPAVSPYNGPTKGQFEEFLELMRAARKFDIATGQKDCPAEAKIKWMRELAEFLGLDASRVDEVLK